MDRPVKRQRAEPASSSHHHDPNAAEAAAEGQNDIDDQQLGELWGSDSDVELEMQAFGVDSESVLQEAAERLARQEVIEAEVPSVPPVLQPSVARSSGDAANVTVGGDHAQPPRPASSSSSSRSSSSSSSTSSSTPARQRLPKVTPPSFYWPSSVAGPCLFTWVPNRNSWQATCPCHFNPETKTACTRSRKVRGGLAHDSPESLGVLSVLKHWLVASKDATDKPAHMKVTDADVTAVALTEEELRVQIAAIPQVQLLRRHRRDQD